MNAVIPYLLYEDADAAIEFLTRVFGFREVNRTTNDDGTIMNAELLGPSGGEVWLGQVPSVSGSSIVYVYVDDADAHCERARAEGATIGNEPEDQFYGDRRYDTTDPQGHAWFFAHPVSEDSPARQR
ncbi:MAG TPA: VOC family protein [Gaiellaceae bacterium]|nr:VOC family protein [Gaiellaceae bacterium]